MQIGVAVVLFATPFLIIALRSDVTSKQRLRDDALHPAAAWPGSREGVIVLGMHRSGTSMLTGLLARAGLQLGKNLIKTTVSYRQLETYRGAPMHYCRLPAGIACLIARALLS
jgi:hypothetical protein